MSDFLVTYGPPVAAALGLLAAWQVVFLLKRRGYHTTYAEALLRAVGAGVLATQSKGIGMFTPEGREIILAVGSHYMLTTVPEAAAALGIEAAGHEKRVEAQLGVLAAQALVGVAAIEVGKEAT